MNFLTLEEADDIEIANTVIRRKSQMWSYEKEWRICKSDSQRIVLSFPEEALSKIVLGCKISDKNKQTLLQLLRKKGNHVEVFQAFQKDDQFGLELQRIDL